MFHQGNVIRRAVWAGSTLVLAVSGLFAGMSGASAATLTGPVIPANANPSFAGTPVSYSCTLSGVTTSTPVTLTATLSAPTSGMAGTAAAITLTTQVMTLPAADSIQLPSLTRATAAGTAASTGMSASTVALTGMASVPAGPATQIPAITITGSAVPSAAGTASIMAPTTLTVTLVAGTTLAAFNCTRTTTTATAVQITVTAATVAAATTGPMYACTVTVAGHTMHQMDRVPMTLSTSGPNTVGSTDTVMLSSPANGLGGSYPAGTSAVSFSGALPLAGAQSGSIPVSGAMANLTGGMFVVRTSLPLMAAGLLHIMPPSRFTVIVHVQQAVAIVAVCVLQTTVTTTMPASTMVNVTSAAMPAATMPAGTTTGTGTTPTVGTMPMGSANTGVGGSLHSANILPELAAGIAVLLAGAGLTVIGLRRRRRHTSA